MPMPTPRSSLATPSMMQHRAPAHPPSCTAASSTEWGSLEIQLNKSSQRESVVLVGPEWIDVDGRWKIRQVRLGFAGDKQRALVMQLTEYPVYSGGRLVGEGAEEYLHDGQFVTLASMPWPYASACRFDVPAAQDWDGLEPEH